MALEIGSRLGHYDVTALIGEGGMGQVYQATDTKLNRQVALKILPEAFASDPDRLARFQREAQVLASLNHPGIAAIYGLEEADDTRALVLELVEGPTLADRIAQGPIPLDEALPIAKQIAEALEAAHEAGVIHRDLKPANVKVKDDGTVKVLDFGLAKAFQPDASDASQSMSPTISLTAAATQMGMVIGTAAYMAPEQAKGKPVDKRADVWAFGAVFYEMLSGKKPFAGDDVSETLARVIDREPDWSALPNGVPPVLETFLRRCLQKNPKQRVHDVADVRLAMAGAFEVPASPAIASGDTLVGTQLHVWQRPGPLLFVALALIATTALVVWTLMLPEPGDVVQFTIVPPGSQAFTLGGSRQDLTITRDGTQVVYHGTDPSGPPGQISLWPLNQLAGTPLRGGEGAGPFVSPNGNWIGSIATQTTLQRVSILGGPPQTLTESPAGILGASWGTNDQIIFGTRDSGLFRVSGGGGDPEPLTALDAEQGETSHTWPFIIPGRDAVVFVIATGTSPLLTGQLAVFDLATEAATPLGLPGVSPQYASTGHLVYATADGSVTAVPFDADSLKVNGDPVPLVEGVVVKPSGAADFSISDNGRLVYALSEGGDPTQVSLVWVSRDAQEELIDIQPGAYRYPRISPDGGRVALDGRSEDNNIWIWDFAQGTRSPLTVGSDARYPVWTSDGDRLAYGTGTNLDWTASNNTGETELLVEVPGSVPSPYFFAPNGQAIVLRDRPATDDNLSMLSLGEPPERIWSLDREFNERNAELSPDNRWMAYESDESGVYQVSVRPFPQVHDDLVPISNTGGIQPRWSRDGRELFYIQPGNPPQLIAVSIESREDDLVVGQRTVVMEWPYSRQGVGRSYDVSLDGRQFLALKGATGGDGEATPQNQRGAQLVRGTHAPRALQLIMPLQHGTTLGPYSVTAKIGEGGMGEV